MQKLLADLTLILVPSAYDFEAVNSIETSNTSLQRLTFFFSGIDVKRERKDTCTQTLLFAVNSE